ncbi:MAG TPA: P-loop NTPase [Haliangiales bacterium]|nr:P-loop NTPase [Haliangiales bacterium]
MTDQATTLRGDAKPVTPIRQPNRVISIAGGKGGVGKSMVAVNLAVLYAQRGSRTLALDGDVGMADLNLLLGVAPGHSLLDVAYGYPIDDVLVAAHGIHLLPGLNGSYTLANLDERSRHALWAAVDSLESRFDTLIVDTAAGIDALTVELAGSAAQVVVVANPEPLSLADAYANLKALKQKQGLERAFVLPNRVRTPSEADEVFGPLSALADRFLGVALTPLPAIPFDASAPQSAAAGVPHVIQCPDAPASRALKQVARRLDALARPDDRAGALRLFLNKSLKRENNG